MAPRAQNFSSSQQWMGNDGNWSTFAIQVGTPPTTLFILPSTSGRSTWVVSPGGCGTDETPSCSTWRSGVVGAFDPDKSSSWNNLTDHFNDMNFGPEAPLTPLLPPYLNYTGQALLGTDRMAFGYYGGDVILSNTLFASYFPKIPFIGVLGLSAYNESINNLQQPYYSPLGSLKSSGYIASQYWGYTAGAYYRQNQNVRCVGSLTFGGYDATRGNEYNVITVPFPVEQGTHTLVMPLPQIILSDSGGQDQTLDMGNTMVFIDSMVPEIWLPGAICTQFEQFFGITWNETLEMYLVNDTLDEHLMQLKPSVTFDLSDGSGSRTQITLPYDALRPMAGWPYLQSVTDDVDMKLRYFPLKRAESNDQYFLGRTFLQEAYVAVDYDNQQFNVSPANFPNNITPENLIMVGTAGSGSGALSSAAIAGIVVGVLASLGIAMAAAWCFFLRGRKTKFKSSELPGTPSDRTPNLDPEPRNEEKFVATVEDLENRPELSGEPQDHVKVELDAVVDGAKELVADTVHGTSEQSMGTLGTPDNPYELPATSTHRGSEQSAISPLGQQQTQSDSIGVPSPQSGAQSSFGRFGSPSPPLSDPYPSPHMSERISGSLHTFGLYEWNERQELHGHSNDSPALPGTPTPGQQTDPVAETTPLVETEPAQETTPGTDQATLQRLDGSGS